MSKTIPYSLGKRVYHPVVKISELEAMLKDTEKEYKNDPQGLKLFTLGYKEMIDKLKGDKMKEKYTIPTEFVERKKKELREKLEKEDITIERKILEELKELKEKIEKLETQPYYPVPYYPLYPYPNDYNPYYPTYPTAPWYYSS